MDNLPLTGHLNRFISIFKPSSDLEDEFKKFMKNFLNSDICVAFPGSFFFIGEHSVMRGQPALNMSIPLYVYVGAKKRETEGISIEMWQRNLGTTVLEKFRAEEREKERLEKEIERILKNKSIKPEYSLYCLFEVPPRCGLNSSGALSAGISVCVGILNGKFSPQNVRKWQTTKPLEELKRDKEFKEAFEMAWRFDWIIQGKSSGIGPFVSLVGRIGEPVIYFLENDVHEKKWESQWYAYFLSEIYNNSKTIMSNFKEWPFALIYSGNPSFTRDVFKKIRRVSRDASFGVEEFVEKLETSEIDLEKITTPLQSLLITKILDGLEKDQIDKKGLANYNRKFIDKIINKLKESQKRRPRNVSEYLLEKIWSVLGGFSIIAIGNIRKPERMVDMMNVYHWVLSALGISTPEIDDICREFQSHEGFGAKLTGSGGGGDVVVFAPYTDKDEIDEIIKEKSYTIHFKSWEEVQREETILKVSKFHSISRELNEKEKEYAYICVISKKLPESPEYKESGKFSEEALKQQREVLSDIEEAIKLAEKESIELDMLVLPEYTLPPEVDNHHPKIRSELAKISKERNIIIIAGSYLSKNFEDICLIFLPNGEIEEVQRLNKCKYDPEKFKEGCGIKIFKNSRIGDFCVIICYDILSKEITETIQEESREGYPFTLFIVSQCPDIKRYKTICDELANPRGKPSNRGLLVYVILVDSYHGLAYYTAPVKGKKKDDFCKPILEKDCFQVFELQIKELKKARTPSVGSDVLYSI